MATEHDFRRMLNDQGIILCQRCGTHQRNKDRISCDERMAQLTGPHLTDGQPCWCEPTVETIDGTDVVIHRDPTAAS